jgi:hypothetical protein
MILDDIINALWVVDDGPGGWRPKADAIALDQVREWMRSEDLEILGHIYTVLNDARFRVDPPISLDEYKRFVMNYYERCLKENPDGEWSDARYSAGWDIVRWFLRLWDDPSVSRSVLTEIKEWLAYLYKSGDAELKQAIAHAIIEHLFERKPVKKFFAEWKNDPELRPAYDEGILWVSHGGKTPLSKRH